MSWKKNLTIFTTLSLTAGATLVGCGGAADKAAEVAAEQAMKKEGVSADVNVDSQGGTVRVAGTSNDGSQFDVSAQGNQVSGTFSGEGGTTTVNTGDQVMVPATFPSDFPIYNGLRPTAVVDSEEEKSIIVTGVVTDSLGDVSDWYKSIMERNNWTEDNSMDMGGQMATMSYKKDNRTATIVITASPTGTQLVLTAASE